MRRRVRCLQFIQIDLETVDIGGIYIHICRLSSLSLRIISWLFVLPTAVAIVVCVWPVYCFQRLANTTLLQQDGTNSYRNCISHKLASHERGASVDTILVHSINDQQRQHRPWKQQRGRGLAAPRLPPATGLSRPRPHRHLRRHPNSNHIL